jgi:hypothetical protein
MSFSHVEFYSPCWLGFALLSAFGQKFPRRIVSRLKQFPLIGGFDLLIASGDH